MRNGFFVLASLIAAGLLAAPVYAETIKLPEGQQIGPGQKTRAKAAEPVKPDEPELTHDQKLDKFFAELKRERSEGAAKRLAGRIQQEWANSGSSSVDLMMGWAKTAMEKQKYDVALDFLDQVITLDPDYAEGWNRRATVHFMMHNFGKSMADIEQTLQLEPRHFGALSGMAQIMQQRGNNQLALLAYTKVLAVYPMDRNAQNQVSTISDELTGDAI